MSSNIHSTAIIDTSARLDSSVEVGPYTVIGPNVRIGAETKVGPHAVLKGPLTIGKGNTIFQFASIGEIPQDLKFKGEETELVIGDGNAFREGVTIHRGTVHGHRRTLIGNGNLFMAYSHVAHDCIVGDDNVFANSVSLAGHVTIGNNAVLGGLVGVHQFTRVGDLAFCGAGSMVDRDAPPFAMVQGDRAHIRGLNLIGLKRAGFTLDEVNQIKRFYRAVFLTRGEIQEKLACLPAELKNVESRVVRCLLSFIEGTKRGFLTRRGEEDDTLS